MDDQSAAAAIAAMTTQKHRIASGLTLRPLTLGTHSLCIRAGLGIVQGKAPENARLGEELATFAWIHSAPLPEVLDAFDAGDKAVRRAVFAFSDRLGMDALKELARVVPEVIMAAMGSLVAPVDSDSAAASDSFDAKN